MPNTKRVVLPNVGHLLVMEDPKLTGGSWTAVGRADAPFC